MRSHMELNCSVIGCRCYAVGKPELDVVCCNWNNIIQLVCTLFDVVAALFVC